MYTYGNWIEYIPMDGAYIKCSCFDFSMHYLGRLVARSSQFSCDRTVLVVDSFTEVKFPYYASQSVDRDEAKDETTLLRKECIRRLSESHQLVSARV